MAWSEKKIIVAIVKAIESLKDEHTELFDPNYTLMR